MTEKDIRAFRIMKKLKLVAITKIFLIIKDEGIVGIFKRIINNFKKDTIDNEMIIRDKKINIDNISSNLKDKKVIDVVYDSDVNFEKIKSFFSNNIQDKKISYNFIKLVRKYDESKIKQISLLRLEQLFFDKPFILITKELANVDKFYYCINILEDNNIEININKILNSTIGLKLLGNYNNKNCVSVKCGTFFNYEGANYYSGGAERYLIDLYEIFKKRNINLDIYQNSIKPFFRKYNGINVIGMSLKDRPLYLDDDFMDIQTKHYIDLTKGRSCLHIYSAFFECYPNHVSPSIGISHGVGWDNEANKNLNSESFWNSKKMIIDSAKKCDSLISVDTNTANWFQTVDYDIGNKKISVIPNYVDINEFFPRENYATLKDKIIIVYPRRLYKPRGLYLVLESLDKILKKYKNVEFHFVGKGFKQETDDIDSYIKKYPGIIKRYSKSPFEMSEVYKNADISLIPTLYSEGTSLSCLEAMASGNIVISTRIGGLSDLIINNYNGYLIEPNAKALSSTLEYVLDNYESQKIIKERAVEVAKVFNKDIWTKRWESVIDEFKIKTKSNNIGLVEFYVYDIENISDKTLKLIKENLINNKLVYVRSKIEKEDDDISCGLIQLIKYDDEIVNVAEKVYVEKNIKNEVKRKENITII